jgi:cytochrome c
MAAEREDKLRALSVILSAMVLTGIVCAHAQTPSGNAERGAQIFGDACAACHSRAANRNMTGPSLAGVWQRKAGTLASFDRYSPEIKSSRIVWDAKSLDGWLESPAKFIPGNFMTLPGIDDPKARADLIVFLKEDVLARPSSSNTAGGMGGMMMSGLKDLKKVGPERRVRAIRLCRDSYFVTKADGKISAFWEPNLRFETDVSNLGPPSGKPAIMPAGMLGDRATIIFAAPEEISRFIKHQC